MIKSKLLVPVKIMMVLLIISSLYSCKDTGRQPVDIKKDAKPIFPVMPLEQQSYLFDNVQLIDYIFFDLPFSLNQSEKPSIQSNIAGIWREPVMENNCKPIARVFYQVEGEIVVEADLFFSQPDCHHYVFYQDGKAMYANQMALPNIQFYSQFLNQMNVTQ